MEESKYEYDTEKAGYLDEKQVVDNLDLTEDAEIENSPIEAVRLVVPVVDDPTLPVITFRFWLLSFLFSVLGSIVNQYYYFRSTSGGFSTYFVNLVSYALGRGMAQYLPRGSVSIGGFSMSLNPGPFNIKEHAMISIAVSTAAQSAYAIDILASMDLYLQHRINALGALILLITTQCVGYGMAGVLRRYLVYPAEMVWWPNLVQVVFFNALHNTDEFKTKKMVRGWSYMKFFWVICGITFVYEFLPQFMAPILVYFDWICWIKPFNFDFWALFSSVTGGGILSMSFDWSSITGTTLYYPFFSQMCSYGGVVLSYWIVLPILWLTNSLGAKTIGHPLTSHLFYASNGTRFIVNPYLNEDYSLNEAKMDSVGAVKMSPMYALCFFFSFIALAGCCSHIAFFHGTEIWKTWKATRHNSEQDIHTKMMKVYPEVPQLWYAIFYVVMAALSIVACEVYGLQLPWWGLIVALAIGWLLTLPICAMTAVTGFGPGLNVITELICGYMLPGKPIANMVFKCYGYMAMYQCMQLLSDLKLGHYMKIPPRAMFVGQTFGTIVGAVFNYFTMTVIINSKRPYLDGTEDDPSGLWTGYLADTYWGSALIYGALGPARMFSKAGGYGFVYYGFLIGAIIPAIQWALSKKFPKIQWAKINITIIAGGMSAYPNGYIVGVLPSIILCIIFQFYLFRYQKAWWQKYTFILAAALDAGTAFTGLFIFLFFGGLSASMSVTFPSWWGNYYTPDGGNGNFLYVDRCGDASGNWTQGGLLAH
ncbi:hypothetical protein BGZ83_008757 [Gryganskiella cystojenkinii]|nr:hypothetical protein BGZ83_008757 [Gryganskiella cystojenkinii]